ncbi:hypothetical protein ANCDUO_04294 [Ancylostoma duodenale]|uniref:Uncharacterized protein n=1 Tax=Ancylostoma duodenale TaxID=51022 RepID=A0A0C2GVF8_9BILA|nr:hypothetical protein ANCDUO_04294 [Ancylostoma duodenale]
MKREVVTRVGTSFAKVVEILKEWKIHRTWVIIWPLDPKMDEELFRKLMLMCKNHIEEGGKVVTAWPLIKEKNAVRWYEMAELWKCLDENLTRFKTGSQVFTTASNMFCNGKLKVYPDIEDDVFRKGGDVRQTARKKESAVRSREGGSVGHGNDLARRRETGAGPDLFPERPLIRGFPFPPDGGPVLDAGSHHPRPHQDFSATVVVCFFFRLFNFV